MLKFDFIKDFETKTKLPIRGTKGASGYDFFSPEDLHIEPQKEYVINTGIRFITDDSSKWLMLMPRSSYGMKYGMRLLNTTGNIDSDYSHSDNGGPIIIKFKADREFTITKGDRIMQGVILNCFTIDNDCSTNERNGGMGSTGK